MNEYNENPWDDGVYGTGRTEPPKSHGGTIAVLLTLVIFLSGIVTVLGVLNIRMFRKLNSQRTAELPITFETEPVETEAALPDLQVAAPMEDNPDVSIDLHQSPEAIAEAEAQHGRMALQDIYEKSIPSVVSITSTHRSGSATGTGVVFSETGYIVTNNHVVEDAYRIDIQLTDDRVFTAELVGGDSVSDLAVLHIDADGLVPAEFGDSENLRVGDSVVAIGDPLGVEFRGTMTDGIISAINRDVVSNGRTLNLIQTNAALNSGNSGGPLINCYGQVIGINTMKIGAFTDNAGVEGLGFAIPSATVKDIVGQLIDQGYVSGRPLLGLEGESLSVFYQRFYRLPAGLYITHVTAGSPAAQAGIEPGDILVGIDDTGVRDMDTLNMILYSHEVGETVTLTLYRNGYQGSITVTLAEAKG